MARNAKFKPGQKLFVLYDERAKSGDVDDAAVLDTSTSEPNSCGDYDAIWYEYTIGTDGVTAENGIPRWDIT
jgi:hypothetical protein